MIKPQKLMLFALLLLTQDLVLAGLSNHSEDPVILSGSDLPNYVGLPPSQLVAWRHDTSWTQIPLQVDERDYVDWGTIYNYYTTIGIKPLVYTDNNTFTGADKNPYIDGNDEIVFMSKDAGNKNSSTPPNAIPGSGTEITLTDPLNGEKAYVYLFQQDGTLDQAAGQSYVDYQFNLLSGDYKSTYSTMMGPNPENSLVITPHYTHHFSDRWINDQLLIHTGGATSVDILDRHKNFFAAGNCSRTEDTFTAGEGAFVTNKNGPVRAIRSYVGANSGPLTQREHFFYAQRHDIHTYLRVHAIPSVAEVFDYSMAALGMSYYNNLTPAGVIIDGNPDIVTNGQLSWELVTGTQGSLTILHKLNTDIPSLLSSTYYLDDSNPAVTQCTGDQFAFGTSGVAVNHPIPCTDPYYCMVSNKLEARRTLYYGAPGASPGLAIDKLNQSNAPLSISFKIL